MSYLDPADPEGQVLRSRRQPRIVRARLVLKNGTHQDIVIRNVSQTGFGASTRGYAPSRNERITALLPGDMEVHGTVRWASGAAFGVELDELLDLDALASALQRIVQTAQSQADWKVGNLHRVVTPTVDPSRIRRV